MKGDATFAAERRWSAAREAMIALRLHAKPAHAIPGGSSVITLRTAETAPGIFVLPGGRGGVAEVASYAALLGPMEVGMAIYGLLFPGHDGRSAVPRSVQAIARQHIEAMRCVQPRGPYLLVGECIGGSFALEMAKQITAAGEHVERVVLLDTWRPTTLSHWRYRVLGVPRLVVADVCERARIVTREWWRQAGSAARGMRGAFRFTLFAARMFPVIAAAALGDHLARPWRRWPRATAEVTAGNAYLCMGMRYRPEPYPGAVSLVVTDEYRRMGLIKGWWAYGASTWDVRTLPGDHADYLGSAAACAVLADCLGSPCDPLMPLQPTKGMRDA